MQSVCSECHNPNFIETFYTDADALVGAINDWVVESNEIIQPLKDQELLTSEAFDEPIDFVALRSVAPLGPHSKIRSLDAGCRLYAVAWRIRSPA